MKAKVGNICMGLGVALVLAALALFCLNTSESRQAESAVSRVMPQLAEQIVLRDEEITTSSGGDAALPDPYDPTMREVEIDGYMYIGYLSVPSLGLELPVMSDWDYSRLRIAPCRYTGTVDTNDLVIAAHNYASHFGTLGSLKAGETVCFTDVYGEVTEYMVVALETLPPTAVEEMTSGEYDLSLFTCTYGGQSRITVRCDKTK